MNVLASVSARGAYQTHIIGFMQPCEVEQPKSATEPAIVEAWPRAETKMQRLRPWLDIASTHGGVAKGITEGPCRGIATSGKPAKAPGRSVAQEDNF